MNGLGTLQLPYDALIMIFTFLESPTELSYISCNSSQLYEAASSDRVWLPFFMSHFSALYDVKYKGREESPREGIWKRQFLFELQCRFGGMGVSGKPTLGEPTKGAWAAETFKAKFGRRRSSVKQNQNRETMCSATAPKYDTRFILLGQYNAGKTVILEHIQRSKQMKEEIITSTPTPAFDIETLSFNQLNIVCGRTGSGLWGHTWPWALGGRLRPLRRQFYNRTKALIFVVDCADAALFTEIVEERHFWKILWELQDETPFVEKDIRVLVFANKQDKPDALSVREVAERLELSKLSVVRPGLEWYIQGCIATTGKGIDRGLDWLCKRSS